MSSALSSINRVALVSAYPPLGNSLSEFGGHLATNLIDQPEVDEVVVLADREAGGELAPAVPGITVEPTWTFNDPTSAARIAAAVRRTRPDAVLCNLQFATFGDQKIAGGAGLLTPAVLAAANVPVGVILHNLVDNVDLADAGFASSSAMAKTMELAGRALTHVLLRADYVAVTIPAYVDLLRERYGATNVVLIPHGTFDAPTGELSMSKLDAEHPGRRRRIVAFGKWGTYKRLEDLVRAYRDLLDRGFDDVELVIAGTDSPNAPGYVAGIEQSCVDLPGVSFAGYVAEEDIDPMFSSAAISVFPYTSTTGSSGVLHQAGSYGCSFVLPRIGDFEAVLDHEGYVASTFAPGDPLALADTLAKLLDDRALQDSMGAQNRAAAAALPFDLIAGWHLLHLSEAAERRASERQRRR